MNRSTGRRFGAAAISAPRLLMSWEDWLTFGAALIAFLAVAVSIEDAHWVKNMPPIWPTALMGLLIGMVAARIRFYQAAIHPVAIALGVVVVVLAVQTYAEGATIAARIDDFQARMNDWIEVVRAGDISNDNLPFVTLVEGVAFLSTYFAAFAVYKWHNPWVAVLPGGLLILVNIALLKDQPSGPFVFFLFGTILLVSRLYMQRSQVRWKKQGVDYPEFISVSTAQLTLIVAVLLLIGAWAIPVGNQAKAAEGAYDAVTQPFRGHSGLFNRLFHNLDASNGGRLHNFGAFLPVQGDVKLGTRELYQVKAGQPGLLRGASYDEYTGAGWKTGDRDETKINAGDLAASPDVAAYEARNVSILQVTVVDGDNTVLTAGMPLGTNIAVTAETPPGFRGDIEQLQTRRGLSGGDTYNSIGSESTATPEQLRAAGTAYPDWVKGRYLQLPTDLPERVKDEARRVTAGVPSPYDRAKGIETYLRGFPYDLTVEAAPPGRDTVDYLLFDLKRGYFDYQATAMAVMLRSLGVPARVAIGYVLDPEQAAETTYSVTKADAYSWVEVFFPRYGWVTFNPTQDRPAVGVGGGLGEGGTSLSDALQGQLDLQSLFGDLNGGAVPPADVTDALDATPIENAGPPWVLIWSLLGALAVLAVVALGGTLTWNWGLGGLDSRGRHWAKAHRLAGWARLGGSQAETAREWSNRVGNAVEQPDPASRLADAYEEARYGRPDLQRIEDEEAVTAYKSLRNAIAASVWRRGRKRETK
jgi:transglutaminase-like putative cysteine protease